MEDRLKIVFSADSRYKTNIIQEVLAENNIKSMRLDQKGSALLLGEIHILVNNNDEANA